MSSAAVRIDWASREVPAAGDDEQHLAIQCDQDRGCPVQAPSSEEKAVIGCGQECAHNKEKDDRGVAHSTRRAALYMHRSGPKDLALCAQSAVRSGR